MSHSETIGGERPAGGEPSSLGARLGRFFSTAFSPVKSTEDPLQETVEFTPEDVEAVEGAWTPRFATVWRGYDPRRWRSTSARLRTSSRPPGPSTRPNTPSARRSTGSAGRGRDPAGHPREGGRDRQPSPSQADLWWPRRRPRPRPRRGTPRRAAHVQRRRRPHLARADAPDRRHAEARRLHAVGGRRRGRAVPARDRRAPRPTKPAEPAAPVEPVEATNGQPPSGGSPPGPAPGEPRPRSQPTGVRGGLSPAAPQIQQLHESPTRQPREQA